MLVRACVIALSAGMTAWLGVQLVEAERLDEANQIVFGTPGRLDAEGAGRAERLIDKDGFGFRHRWQFLRAVLLQRTDRLPAAIRQLQAMVREEPANVEDWALLATISRERYPAIAARARARLRQLIRRPPPP
jgi:hypothetical protein